MTTKTERIKAACIAGAEAAKAGLPEEPPKGLTPHQIASWRMGWEGVATMESLQPEPAPEAPDEQAERQYEEIDIDGSGPVRVPILTEEEKRYYAAYSSNRFDYIQDPVYRELRAMHKKFQNEHKHQPGEGAWFVFMHPQPEHAPILRDFEHEAQMATVERGFADDHHQFATLF